MLRPTIYVIRNRLGSRLDIIPLLDFDEKNIMYLYFYIIIYLKEVFYKLKILLNFTKAEMYIIIDIFICQLL